MNLISKISRKIGSKASSSENIVFIHIENNGDQTQDRHPGKAGQLIKNYKDSNWTDVGELEGMEKQYVYFLNSILLSYVLSKWLNLMTIWYINNDMESDHSSTQGVKDIIWFWGKTTD